MTENLNNARLPHVIVVGGGFAGVSAVRNLRNAPVRVTLIDKNPYSTFKPLLFQVANGSLNAGDITYFLRSIRSTAKNARFVNGELTHVDTDEKTVELADGRSMKYDYLVLAGGTTAAFFGIPGAAENTLPMYSRDEALTIRDRFYGLLEGLDAAQSTDKFRVVVAGGGPTGVETATSLAEVRNNVFATLYPDLDPAQVEIVLVDMLPNLLNPFTEKTQQYAAKELEARGVQLWLKKAVKEVEPERIKLADADTKEETWYDANMVIWGSGVGVDKSVADWGVPQGARGRLPVDEHLQMEGLHGVFAAGDIALIGERGLPQLAQPAIQGGAYVAKYITALEEGYADEVPPFEYHDRGTMAYVGAWDAAAELPKNIQVYGPVGFLMWNAVHVAQLNSWRERVATTANLGSRFLWAAKSGDYNIGDYQPFAERFREGTLSGARSLDAEKAGAQAE